MGGFWHKQIGTGRCCLDLFIYNTGQGIQALLVGGERPHIGGVVLALPRLSLESETKASGDYFILPVPRHKDTITGEMVAEILVQNFKVPISVTAGIHSDDISAEELAEISANCRQLALKAVEELTDRD
jgi:hypothetical protein